MLFPGLRVFSLCQFQLGRITSSVQKVSPDIQIQPLLTDSFSDNYPPGQTIGTKSDSGLVRQGIDVEGLIGIDDGALRMQPLLKAGWGRQGIVYGPYTRRNGLMFAVSILNGHNTSNASTLGERLRKRLRRWFLSSEVNPPRQRLIFWLKSNQKQKTLRRFFWWLLTSPRFYKSSDINENLAVGWFPNKIPKDPLSEGNSLIMHAAEENNGELWARVGNNLLSAFQGLQNLHIYYLVILREKGAAYYIASVPNAHGLVAFPNMRPIAIDAYNDDSTLYAGFYQSVLGQIGFSVDSRVYGVHIKQIPELMTWYGTAHAADRLLGEGSLNTCQAEMGGPWTVYSGDYQRTVQGVQATIPNSVAVLHPNAPSGLVHGLIETVGDRCSVCVLWRFQDLDNFWRLQLSRDGCELQIQQWGQKQTIAVDSNHVLKSNQVHSLQILDDGAIIRCYLDGMRLFDHEIRDTRLQEAFGVGLSATEPSPVFLRYFEVHPRSIPIPDFLAFDLPWMQDGRDLIVADSFQGSGQDLAEQRCTQGNRRWQKTLGKGTFQLTGQNSVQVKASPKTPNPGRTVYTVAWENPEFADVAVDIIPPGTNRGQGEKGRGGLIFWQDLENYIIINNWVDDCYGGSSISSFFMIHGFEDLYDAVWTNVGHRIKWGVSHNLRIVFDGLNYMAFVNREPVLYRSLRDVYPDTQPLMINRVGIVANWEWGNDTGSVFRNFIAKV